MPDTFEKMPKVAKQALKNFKETESEIKNNLKKYNAEKPIFTKHQLEDQIASIYKKKLEFVRFPDEERAKLLSKAEGVHKKWIKLMQKRGLPGQEVYDYFLAKRKEIAGF